jgi:hypothetical protein
MKAKQNLFRLLQVAAALDGRDTPEKRDGKREERFRERISHPSDACASQTHGSLCVPIAIIEKVVPRLLSVVAPGDAPIVLRTTTLITNAWFDAIAPYNPKATGVYSTIPKYANGTDHQRNISLLVASHAVLNSLLPQFEADWDDLLTAYGIDPADSTKNPKSPIGIGNLAGAAVVAEREQDGMNQLGDANGALFNRTPYADTTGYKAINTATDLIDARYWQPDIVPSGRAGSYESQIYVTPQWAKTVPYSYEEPSIVSDPPEKSLDLNENGAPGELYKFQVEEVLNVQSQLSDRQKMGAEFFDNKIASLGLSIVATAIHYKLSLEEFVQLDFLTNAAAFDTGITIWDNKTRYNSVRPFSAVRSLFSEDLITAWGGPGQGTVDNITGREWRPYLPSANHPEYPSATAGFAKGHETAAKLYLTKVLGFSKRKANNLAFWKPSVPVAGMPLGVEPGSSVIEPGITPAKRLILGWETWSEFSAEAGDSRLLAGVHFADAIPAGQIIGEKIGKTTFEWFYTHISDTAI